MESVLERFGKQDARPISTPLLANQHIVRVDQPEVDVCYFQSTLGSVMWAMLGTCSDLAYTVGALSQFSTKPSKEVEHVLTHVFKYLRGTSDTKLTYQGKRPESRLTGYVDADWAGDVNNRKSISGYVFKLSSRAISWSSKKQGSTALSSTKAEYIAGTHTAKELIWLCTLLADLRVPCTGPTCLLIDNQSAMAIAQNTVYHTRTKHIGVRDHFLRERVISGDLKLEYVPIGDQVADIMTKGLLREKHEHFSKGMGLQRVG